MTIDDQIIAIQKDVAEIKSAVFQPKDFSNFASLSDVLVITSALNSIQTTINAIQVQLNPTPAQEPVQPAAPASVQP